MLRIEEYILKRKKEDKLNEFEIEARNENMRLCVNYVFEYYNNYLNIIEAEERTVLKDDKLEKYYHQLRDYEPEVKDWLVGIYSEYGKQLNRYIGNILKEDSFFYLYNSDSEFRNLSYDCYSKLIKKFPYLKDRTEMLFLSIKEYHRVLGQTGSDPSSVYISEEISEWVQGTWAKYQVNLLEFAFRWVNDFYDNEDTWPSTHRKKSTDSWRKYEYDHKQKVIFSVSTPCIERCRKSLIQKVKSRNLRYYSCIIGLTVLSEMMKITGRIILKRLCRS